MPSPRVLGCLFAVVCCATMGSSDEPKEKANDAEVEKAKLTVHFANDASDHGLCLRYPKEISASAAQPIKFPIVVRNLLEEEVFLEVTGYDDVSYELGNRETGSWVVGGGSEVMFPDNTRLLKRLHASSYKGGRNFTCGCAMALITAQVAFDKEVPLKDFIGQKAKITLTISGYYRNNGKRFEKRVEMPVTIVK